MGEPDDGVVEYERGERFGFAPFSGFRLRGAGVVAPYHAGCRNTIAEGIVSVFNDWLVVGDGGNEAAVGVVGINGHEDCTLEAGSLFADSLAEEVFVALSEARRRCSFALHGTRPARAIGENAVGVEFGRDGGAGD